MELNLQAFEKSLSEEGSLRKHRIVCADRVFFVNGHFMGEQSPFFESLFFGSFKEAKNKTLTLGKNSKILSSDVLEYLCVLYGRKDVSVANCAALIRLADQWDTPSLREKCELFLTKDAAVLHGMKPAIVHVVNFVGQHSRELLQRERLVERVEDKAIIAAIFDLVGKYSLDLSHELVPVKPITNANASPCGCYQCAYFTKNAGRAGCLTANCRVGWKCRMPGCEQTFCDGHRFSTVCARRRFYPVDQQILFGTK